MSMKVATRQVDGVTILDLSGRITLGEGSVTLRDAVHDVLAKGSKKILLNLGEHQLHRQLRHRRTGQRLHLGQESRAASSSCSTSPRRSTTCSRSPSSIPSSTSGTTRPAPSAPSGKPSPCPAIARPPPVPASPRRNKTAADRFGGRFTSSLPVGSRVARSRRSGEIHLRRFLRTRVRRVVLRLRLVPRDMPAQMLFGNC